MLKFKPLLVIFENSFKTLHLLFEKIFKYRITFSNIFNASFVKFTLVQKNLLNLNLLKWRFVTVKIRSCTVQNGAELGVLGDEYNKSLCREGRPRLPEDNTHRPTTPTGIFSRVLCISAHMRDSLLDSQGCSRTVSFVSEQSGSPFPARGLIILVTKHPELSTILNCVTSDLHGYELPF